MDIKAEVIELIVNYLWKMCPDMMDEDLFDAGVEQYGNSPS